MNVPGLTVVAPSNPYDAKGLLTASIRSDNPVVFMEHKGLYGVKGPVPKESYEVPLYKAQVKRPGQDVTVVAGLKMVKLALEVRLIQGEVELRSGARAAGRRRLADVEKEASQRGLRLIARRARVASPSVVASDRATFGPRSGAITIAPIRIAGLFREMPL